MLAFDGPEVSDAAADVRAYVFRDVGRHLAFGRELDAAVGNRFDRRRNRIMNKRAHLARVFLGNERKRVEVFNFAGKPDRKLLGVELLDVVSATAPGHQRGPGVFDSVANRGDEAEACNHDTTCQIRTPWEEPALKKPGAFSVQSLCSLCLCGDHVETTETQRTQRLHREDHQLLFVLVDIVVRVAHTLNILSIFVGNLNAKLFFKTHHEFDRVQLIGAEVVD